jgi:membrane protease YdiL (CAAX protease family)
MRTPRVEPGVWPAAIVVIGYAILVPGLMQLLGPSYDEIFRSATNTWNGAVIPLAAGAAYVMIAVSILRWDHVFKDPERLSMTKPLWAPLVLMVAGLLVRFTGIKWGSANLELILAILTAGVLVGFCEETIFRGILLRGLRTGTRPEIKVILYSSLAFGFFHVTNIASAGVAPTLVQVVLASISGFALYLARRATGLLVAGMVLHGLWDISTFFAGITARNSNLGVSISSALMFLNVVIILIAFFSTRKRDSKITMTADGLAAVG